MALCGTVVCVVICLTDVRTYAAGTHADPIHLAGETVSGSATLPAGGSMPFTERFRTVSESSAVENFYLASAAQKNVRQQIRQESVEVKAGTSLSEAFSQKGLRGGSFKGRQTSASFDVSQIRMRSTSIASTDSDSSLSYPSPSASLGSGDFVFLRSGGSTPSNSSGLTAGMAQALPPVPTDVLPPQHTDPSNPLYRTPNSLPTNPLYNTPVPPLPSPGANAMYNTPRAMQDAGNPMYNTPRAMQDAGNPLYNTPRAMQDAGNPMYNTPRAMQDAGNPLYNTPRAMQDAGNPLYNTPRAMQDAGNPMYNTPRAMQDAGNPLYKSPTKSYPPQQQYSSPSSIPANPGPKYNTLPSRGPRSALLGAANSSPLPVPNPGYDTPKVQLAAADSPATRQQPDSSQPVDRVSRSGSTKSHRSALLKEISMEDSDPTFSPDEAQLPGTTVKGPVPKPRSDRKLKESIPEEGAVAEDQEEPPLPPVRREIKPAQNADALSDEEPPPPVNRAQKPHFEPPKPPTIDRSTKPLASATAIHDSSSDEEDSEEGEEEFGEVPQKSDDTLHYVKLHHLSSPPPAVTRPVPKPRRNLPAETEPTADTEYTMVDKQKTAELSRRLSDLAVQIGPEQGAGVRDAKVVDDPGYVNVTPDGEVDVENDPQYYTVMTVSRCHGDHAVLADCTYKHST